MVLQIQLSAGLFLQTRSGSVCVCVWAIHFQLYKHEIKAFRNISIAPPLPPGLWSWALISPSPSPLFLSGQSALACCCNYPSVRAVLRGRCQAWPSDGPWAWPLVCLRERFWTPLINALSTTEKAIMNTHTHTWSQGKPAGLHTHTQTQRIHAHTHTHSQ